MRPRRGRFRVYVLRRVIRQTVGLCFVVITFGDLFRTMRPAVPSWRELVGAREIMLVVEMSAVSHTVPHEWWDYVQEKSDCMGQWRELEGQCAMRTIRSS